MKTLLLLFLISFNVYAELPVPNEFTNLEVHKYEGFTLYLNCKERGPERFEFSVTSDKGNSARADKFSFDPQTKPECQQLSTKPYSRGYDRGHQVGANSMDNSENTIRESNLMTNILPQIANMNRGAWLQTEMITECYRDVEELKVYGGAIWGNDKSDDLFVTSHGVRTPSYFWKVIIRGKENDQRVIAWLIPNIKEAKAKMLDNYLTSVKIIEPLIKYSIPGIKEYNYDIVPETSWQLPKGCDRS